MEMEGVGANTHIEKRWPKWCPELPVITLLTTAYKIYAMVVIGWGIRRERNPVRWTCSFRKGRSTSKLTSIFCELSHSSFSKRFISVWANGTTGVEIWYIFNQEQTKSFAITIDCMCNFWNVNVKVLMNGINIFRNILARTFRVL